MPERPACCVSGIKRVPRAFTFQPADRQCLRSVYAIAVSLHASSVLCLTGIVPSGVRGRASLPFADAQRDSHYSRTLPTSGKKTGILPLSSHMSPASWSATFMTIFMLVAAVGWLKYDMFYTDIRLRLPSERSAATGGPGSTDPAWSEQVRGIPLRYLPKYRAGARDRAHSFSPLLLSRFLPRLYGLNGWLKFVVVLLGYGVSRKSGDGSYELLRQPLYEVPRGIQGANPLARVMSPTHMRLLVDGYRGATATLVRRVVGSMHMDLPGQAEDRGHMVLSFLWIMDLFLPILMPIAYRITQLQFFDHCLE